MVRARWVETDETYLTDNQREVMYLFTLALQSLLVSH